ncbi:MAG: hypothetical protein J5994_10785 [Ruminococcus sp.]|nr:hypothetical protein [Ruminococcus sp.]
MRTYSRKRYREQKFSYSNYMEVNLYPVYEFPRAGRRKTVRKPSKEVQVKLNQKHAERRLARLIANNFTSDDYKLELTYSDKFYPDSLERAKRDIQNFFRRLNRVREKQGLSPTKYIYSIEAGTRGGRIHFHLILTGGLSLKEIQKIWGKGYVDAVLPLMFDETGVQGIAKYFCKQKLDENGNIDGKYAKRYQRSRNCVEPEPKTNDYRFSKKKVREIAEDSENRRMVENYYPDFFCAECKPFWNDNNGEFYITIMLYRKDTVLDLKRR